jgi:hypothetical protein
MLNYGQQQQPGLFPSLAELEGRVHGIVPYALGGIGAVGGYFWGIEQQRLPVALCIGLGLVGGILLVAILRHLTEILLGAVIVIGASGAAYFLLKNDHALKAQPAQSAPARPGWLESVIKAVQP